MSIGAKTIRSPKEVVIEHLQIINNSGDNFKGVI